ncbi:MAG: translocation/assembly module TamB domain-containing protein [Paracoccus sp. (in: a-proteobacteria)]|uniref:translocation/assembly module TamB domain-containing protein n=1 Tax=Paracoccus sp. TaxID=267 RepID=UPI0026E0FA63|nr:translocation/assembly module TamB domain-containing protein [Paracoccus sp. (in: a-proteobacteria)]MDO5614261.1 translocation/assembly module TamB domain-containing protein [Paracoccus sp. (in: a-proteobacteria)]
MRKILAALAFVWITAPIPAPAQSPAEAQGLAELSQQVSDDRGFITRLLEQNLSGAGRSVQISNFQGALSSRATFSELTIADDDGVWLTLRDGAIQWNRSALLRRRIEIAELSAAEILLPRLPAGEETDAISPEVPEFRLPELPVGIAIDQIQASRVTIGEPVIGIDAVVSMQGQMNLSGGEGTAVLSIDRQDGPRGQFALDAGYSNSTRVLKLDLTLDEAADGLLANLIDLHGKPALHAEITGEGPISDFAANIALATDGQPRVTGRASVDERAGSDGSPGTGFRLELGGDVASLLAPENRAFFGTSTQLLAEGWQGDDGRLDVPVLMIDTEAMNLSGALSLTDQGAPQSAVLMMTLGADAGAAELPVRMPFTQDTMVQNGRLSLEYDAARGQGWSLTGHIGQFQRPGLTIGALELNGAGQVLLQGSELSEITGQIGFGTREMAFADPAMARAVGDSISGQTNFGYAPMNAAEFSDLRITGADYGLDGYVLLAGLSGGITVSGDVVARYQALDRLSGLAGRPLSGQAEAQISGLYQMLTRAFDVNAEITGTDITADQDQLDRLLRGQSNILASVRRDENGIEINELSVNAQQLTATAQGLISSLSSDVSARIEMADLSAADAGFGGSLRAEALLNGPAGQRRLTLSGETQDLELGLAELDGLLAGRSNLTVIAGEGGDGAYKLEQLRLASPQITLDGNGNFAPGELDATLNLDLPDLAALGRGMSGALTAQATARETGGIRRFDLTGTGQNLRLGQQNVDGALTGTTQITLSGTEQDGQISIEQARLTNDQSLIVASGQIGPQGTDLTAQAEVRRLESLGLGWRGSFSADASFADDGSGARRLVLDGTANDLALGQSQVDAALTGPTQVQLRATERSGVFSIEDAQIRNARLEATATGQVGQAATDLTARINARDLRFLGNGIAGSLTADGRITDDGTTRRISAQGSGQGLRAGQEQADRLLAGTTTFDLAASQQVVSGAFSVQRLNLRNPQLTVTGDGSPTAGLNLDARLADLGLLVQGFPGPAQVTGTVRQTGTNYAVNLTATGPGGTRAQVSGTAAQDFATTDLRIAGISDAAVANPFLRTRSIEGPINFDLAMRGPPGLDGLSGTVRLLNGRLAEPRLGIRLEALDLTANLSGRRIAVEGAGNVAAGGRVTVNGPVDLDAGSMDVLLTLDNVTIRDPNLYEALLNGSVRASGVMAQGLLISGRVAVPNAEIRIPSTGLGGSTPIPDITHVGDTRPVRATRAKAGLEPFPGQAAADAGMVGPPATPPANPPRLDLTIDAPNQIFIRGRGVDAEMGGQMRITGTSRNVVPVGMLELIRGRVDLLGKRFDLTEGRVELQGSMTPVIRLVAETVQDDVITRIIIDGDASDPDINFEASPDMPEEEVLSQLLFGRGLDNITPLQAAQLANAVAVLAGRGGDGIVGRLRQGIGLDDLDLATDDEGNVQVRAGKYLADNVYTDVAVGDDGKTQLNLNLDINQSLRARGTVSSDGQSSIGLFYERDY